MLLKAYQRLTLGIVHLVNAPRSSEARLREAVAPRAVQSALCEGAHLAVERGLAAGTLAEISLRLRGGKLLINSAGAWLARLAGSDLAVVSIQQEWTAADTAPARHVAWHRAIYAATDAAAVVLCQPAAAMVIANTRTQLDPACLRDAPTATDGLIWAAPETEAIRLMAARNRVLLIPGYGMLAWGESVTDALARAETANHWCAISLAMEQ